MDVDRVVIVVAPRSDDLDERAALAIAAHGRALEGQLEVIAADGPVPPAEVLRGATEFYFAEPGVRGVIWVDVPDEGPIELRLVPADEGRVYGAMVDLGEGGPALALEGLGNVVSSASAALLGGASIAGMSNATVLVEAELRPVTTDLDETETSATPVVTRHTDDGEARAWNRLTIGAGYTGNTYASQQAWQHGAALRLGWQPTRNSWVAVGYDVVTVATFEDPRARLRVARHPISARAGYGFRLGRRQRWIVPLGGRVVVDPTTQTTEAVDPAFDASGRSTQVQVGLGALSGVMFETSRWLRIRLDVGADVMLGRNSYVVLTPERETFVQPDPVRFVVGLSMDFTGVRR